MQSIAFEKESVNCGVTMRPEDASSRMLVFSSKELCSEHAVPGNQNTGIFEGNDTIYLTLQHVKLLEKWKVLHFVYP